MKRKLISLALVFAMLISASGCSKPAAPATPDAEKPAVTEEKKDDKKEETAPAANDAAASDQKTTLTWTNWESGTALQTFEAVAADFTAKNPNIEIKILNIPEEYDTKLTAMIASNQAPDIASLESASMLYPLAEEGKLVNLLDYVNTDTEFAVDTLLPEMKYMKDDNTMVGYGLGAEDIVMFYNPLLFEKAGVAEPPAAYADAWDWDTFVNNAKLLTVDESGNNAASPNFDATKIKQYGVQTGQWWALWGPFVASNGGDYLSADGKSLGLLEEPGLKALQNIVDLMYVHNVCPTPTSGQALPGLSESITTGKVAMNIGGQWSNLDLMTDEVNYKVAALPKMGASAKTMSVAACLSIFAGEKQDASWKFFKHFYSPGSTLPLEKSGLWLPTISQMYSDEHLTDWITDKHPAGYKEAIALPIKNGDAVQTYTARIANFSKINDIVGPALDSAWAGEKTVKEALEGVKAQAEAEIKGFRK